MDIICQDVTKRIKDKTIIDHINLRVNSGDVFGFIGPNGAGKTTFIRLMLNLYDLSEGSIYIDGKSVESKAFLETKSQISVLLDCLGLYKDLTAWDNVSFFDRIVFPKSTKAERKKRIENILDEVGLIDHKDEKIHFFSKGMKQRLALARAFNTQPRLLIMDEPTTGLDIEGQFLIREHIQRLKKNGTTVFINSHNLDALEKVCNRFAFISKGKLMEMGTLEEMSLRQGLVLEGDRHYDLESLYKKVMA